MVVRCTKCILPASVPGIEFDETGVCNYCRGRRASIEQYDFAGKDEEFKKLVEKQKERRSKNKLRYDVLVPVSGGRDSTYTAWRLVNDFGAKVLCVNYRNPFSSEQAQKNIQNLVERLHLDLVTFPDRFGVHKKSFRTNLIAWMKRPDLANVSLMCLACQSIYLNIFSIASRHDIELIIAGANPYEITGFKSESQGVEDLDRHRVLKLAAQYSKKILRNRSYIRPVNIIPAVNAFLSLWGDAPYLRMRYPRIRKSAFFYYFPYREDEINRALASIGWKKADDNPSPWRFDCEVDSVKNYIYEQLIGVTEKDDLFSRYIRAGLMSRGDALERLASEAAVNREIVKRVLGVIGLEISQLDDALARAKAHVL